MSDQPEIPLEHADWEVWFGKRKVFGEMSEEKPWIRHQQLDPIVLHLCEPRVWEGEEPKCICNKEIPPVVMAKYWWMKAVYAGKRAGAKITPDGVTMDPAKLGGSK